MTPTLEFEARVRIADIRALLSCITADERVKVFAQIAEDYCRACGNYIKLSGVCHCENGEPMSAPAPGSRWLHRRDKRVVQVVRIVNTAIHGEVQQSVDYRYERTVGGMGRDRTTPVQSMALETWRGIFNQPAPERTR